MSRYRIAAIVAALFLLLGIVGRMDADDAKLQQDQYCDMVKAGYWPDFQGTYRSECRTPKSVPR